MLFVEYSSTQYILKIENLMEKSFIIHSVDELD